MATALQFQLLRIPMPWANTKNVPFGVNFSELWAVYCVTHQDLVHGGVFEQKRDAQDYLDKLKNPEAYPEEFIPDAYD